MPAKEPNIEARKIDILLIAPPMAVVGGQSVQAGRLCSRLRENPSLTVSFQPTIILLRFRYIRTFVNFLVYLAALLRRIPGSDIVHVFTAGYFSFLLVAAPALLLGRLLRKKTVLHYHDGRAFDHLAHWPGAVAICGLANTIITPTGFLVAVFAKFGLHACPIANTLEVDDYPFRVRGMPAPLFLHNRGLKEEYNVECTLRAFALVQKHYPEAQLVMANEGPLQQGLKATANSFGLQNVVFTGAVSQEQMMELYDKADIYLSSADADNMPGSVLEAFASGLPVIATRAGGTEWIVRDRTNGILVDCGDYRAMAKAALQLLEEKGLAARLATAARRDAAAYSWARTGWKWVDLYHRLLEFRAVDRSLGGELECSSR